MTEAVRTPWFTRVTQATRSMPRELRLFAAASLAMGMAYSMYDSVFNNFLNARFVLSPSQRSFLEMPRELPGFLVVFVSALLWFLCSRRLGAFSMLLGILGTLLIGFASSRYEVMVGWLFIYSMGQHLFMPVASTIGMELAEEGKTGQRLGQLNAIRNLAAIMGGILVTIGFRYLNFTFQHAFVLSAAGFAIAAALLFSMRTEQVRSSRTFLTLRKEYRLYYLLAVLYGSRKQLFITFAPWVLVTIFKQPTEIMATLFWVGGIIGIMFQPLLGWMIDHWGERTVLAAEALMLIFVCAGYGFARSLFPDSIALVVVIVCYLLDQMLMSVNMARTTFMKKIARDPAHIQPALSAGVSIDHIFSISIAMLGGIIWDRFGFQYLFLMGAGIALLNLFAALRVRPQTQKI